MVSTVKNKLQLGALPTTVYKVMVHLIVHLKGFLKAKINVGKHKLKGCMEKSPK